MKLQSLLTVCLLFNALAGDAVGANVDKKILETKVNLSAAEQNVIDLRKGERLSDALTKSFKRGLELQSCKKFKNAIFAYRHVLKSNPELIEASYNIGLCYEKLGDYQEAESTFVELVKKDPLFDLGFKHLAYINFKRGNFEKSSAYYQKYLESGRP